LFSCSAADSRHDSDASRVTFIIESETTLVAYDYNGVGELVGTTYDAPDVMWKMYGSSGSYPDIDRFNRVTSSRWSKDLATDVDFYDVDLEYDRNSNITSAVDNVHAGFDVIYSMDELNRLKQAEEGTKSGGSITSKTRDEQWVLSQTGNWKRDKLDLNGDGDYLDTNELDEVGTYNKVNEISTRDIDNDSTPDYSPTYDAVGNLTDDQELYEYGYDAFGRLRTVKNTTTQALKSEFKYNGLGYRISTHQDTDTDGDVDGDDKWFHFAYDEGWRMVATFRENDSDPKEVFLHNQAGDGGFGGSSYIDSIALRDKDANTAWTTASDGTLEERVYYCQNWRSDVSAIVTNGGSMKEWVKYSAYGVPQGLPFGDTDSDGDRDATDVTQVQTWIDAPAYDVRGDADLDGDVDATDKSAVQASTVTMGRGALSDIGNRRGYAGYEYDTKFRGKYHVRNRVLDPYLGRWVTRDKLGYVDGSSLYSLTQGNPLARVDPQGLKTIDKCTPGTPTQRKGPHAVVCTVKVALEIVNLKCITGGGGDDCDSDHCNWTCSGYFAPVMWVGGTKRWKQIREQGSGPGSFASKFYRLIHGAPPGAGNTGFPVWTGPKGTLHNGMPGPMNGKSAQQVTNITITGVDCDSTETVWWTMTGNNGTVLSVSLEFPCVCSED
jgi:RHS repeat-associated protein